MEKERERNIILEDGERKREIERQRERQRETETDKLIRGVIL